MLDTLATSCGTFTRGEIYEVRDAIAHLWDARGLCEPIDQAPPHVKRFMERLDHDAGWACIHLPHLGEFGHRIMTGIRIAHWHKCDRQTSIMCCRPGEQVLYPSYQHFCTDWKTPAHVTDAETAGTMHSPPTLWPELIARYPHYRPIQQGSLTLTQETILLHPEQRLPFRPRRRGLRATIVISPRHRALCPEKNWPHWHRFCRALIAQGIDFAVIGTHATTTPVVGCSFHSGSYDTDAAIELLQNCELYVGTDTGSSHLAACVGARMLVFGFHDTRNRDLTPQMKQVNAGNVTVLPDAVWSDPQAVIDATLKELTLAGAN